MPGGAVGDDFEGNTWHVAVYYYHSFHRLREWQEELVSANQDISSETSDTQAAD